MGALGASVVINYAAGEQQAQEPVRTIEGAGGTAIAVQADVSKVADIDRLCATTIERFGRLVIVVANAGIERVGLPLADVTESDYDQVFDVNTRSFLHPEGRGETHCRQWPHRLCGLQPTAFPRPGYPLYG